MTHSETSRKVAVYTRVSTHEQAVEGVSLDAQSLRCRQWAELYGATVVEVVEDAGVSGKTLSRDGLSHLWDLVRAGRVDTVVVTELSRLTRSAKDFANIVADLTEAGVSVVSIDNGLDTSDMCGRLVAGILSYVNAFEREQISHRTREALAQVKREGRHIGRPPVGFTSEGGILIPADDERLELARRAAELKAQGQSLRAIAATFNAEGVLTGSQRVGGYKAGSASKWYPASVSRLLRAAALAA